MGADQGPSEAPFSEPLPMHILVRTARSVMLVSDLEGAVYFPMSSEVILPQWCGPSHREDN